MATNQALVEAIWEILSGGPASGIYGGATRWTGSQLGFATSQPIHLDPVNVDHAIFTIAGGPILLTGLFGFRTTIQGGAASNIYFTHSTPLTNLNVATATTTIDPVGTVYTITGDNTNFLIISPGTTVLNTFTAFDPGRLVAISTQYGGFPMFMLGLGNIGVRFTAANATGACRYVCFWIPVDAASTVIATP